MIEVEAGALRRSLGALAGVLSAKSVLPERTCVRLTRAGADLALSADGELASLSHRVPAVSGEWPEGAVAAVPAHLFSGLAQTFARERVTLEPSDKALLVRCGTARARLPVARVEAFLGFPEAVGFAPLGEVDLTRARRVGYARGTSHVKPAFQGVQLELGESSRAAATDGFRLASVELGGGCALTATAVLAGGALAALTDLADRAEGPLEAALGHRRLHLRGEGVRGSFALYEGTLPEYERLLAFEPRALVRVDRKALHDLVRRAALFQDSEERALDLHLDGHDLTVGAASDRAGSLEDRLEVQNLGPGAGLRSLYRPRQLNDALAASDDDTLDLRFGPARQLAWTDSAGQRALLSPVHERGATPDKE